MYTIYNYIATRSSTFIYTTVYLSTSLLLRSSHIFISSLSLCYIYYFLAFFLYIFSFIFFFFFSSRRRHTRLQGDWSSDVCSSDLASRRSLDSSAFSPWPPCTSISPTSSAKATSAAPTTRAGP